MARAQVHIHDQLGMPRMWYVVRLSKYLHLDGSWHPIATDQDGSGGAYHDTEEAAVAACTQANAPELQNPPEGPSSLALALQAAGRAKG